MTKHCRWCGKEFTAKYNSSQYCSSECKKSKNKAMLKWSKKPNYTIKCAWCGEIFSAGRKRKYCCYLCSLRGTGKINGIAKHQKGKHKIDKPFTSIEEVAKICGEQGISYGQYMTRYGDD